MAADAILVTADEIVIEVELFSYDVAVTSPAIGVEFAVATPGPEGPEGPQGPQGDPGIHVGVDPPTDPQPNDLWLPI